MQSLPICQRGSFGISFVLYQSYNTGHIQSQQKKTGKVSSTDCNEMLMQHQNYQPTLIFTSMLLAKNSGQSSNQDFSIFNVSFNGETIEIRPSSRNCPGWLVASEAMDHSVMVAGLYILLSGLQQSDHNPRHRLLGSAALVEPQTMGKQ